MMLVTVGGVIVQYNLHFTSHMVFSIFEYYANTIMVTKVVTMLVDLLCLVLSANMRLVKNT